MFKRKHPARPTFVSFVENTIGEDVSSSPSLPDTSDQSDTTSFCSPVNAIQNDDAFELKLLAGEIVVSKVPQVSRFLPFSDGGSAVFGSIVVTNFRVAFISLSGDDTSDDVSYKSQFWNHKFIRRDDILLTNISEIYQVGKNKRKKLEKGINVSESMNKLEIFCKDMSIHSFSLLSREGQLMKKLVTQIIQFVFPSRHDLLFANSYRGPFVSQGFQSPALSFHDRYDWVMELNEFNVTGFRVTSCNAGFALTESLPPCFVVPETLTDDLISRFKLSESNKAFPIWSYTHHNGVSLIRMASENIGGTEKLCIDHVRKTAVPKAKGVVVMDLTPSMDAFPSVQDLQESYVLLRQLCMPSSNKDVWSGDMAWLSTLESTRWLLHISRLLSTAKKVVQYITDSRSTVILKEPGGNDFTPIISCLSQLMMQPKYRTIEGFQRLIDKEWVAMGHRFCERLGLISSKQKAPVFHAFLDCVWQLIQQFPHEFEFTTVYLTALHDSTFVGLFDSFIFNTPKHRMFHFHKGEKPNLLAKGGRLNKSSPALQSPMDVIKLSPPSPPSMSSKARHFMTVWDWELQYSSSDTNWFKNPMFYIFSSDAMTVGKPSSEELYEAGKDASMSDSRTGIRNSNYPPKNSTKTGISQMFKSCSTSRTAFPVETHSVFYKSSIYQDANFIEDDGSHSLALADIPHSLMETTSMKSITSNGMLKAIHHSCLSPEISMSHMKLWDHCYLRWISPLELIGGSQFAEYFTQIHLVLDIISLKKNISKTECQIQLISSTDSEASGFSCSEFNSSLENDSTFETGATERTVENSSFYITNFLTEPEKLTPTPVSSCSDVLQESNRKLQFPNPPECFTSSFPYIVERPPSTFATPMTFSNDSQRVSYIESDMVSIDDMTNSMVSNC